MAETSSPKRQAMQSDDSSQESKSVDLFPTECIPTRKEEDSFSVVMEPSKTASEPDLLPDIWQELPIELLTVVLTKLPASALETFCLVSKSWEALIQSPEFAYQCSSVESVVCYFSPIWWDNDIDQHPYIARPNLKTGSWEKRRADVDNEKLQEDYDLIAADHGLFCYRSYNVSEYEAEIFLCVHNPVTDVFRWIMVPYSLDGMENRSSNSILGGLVMDQRTGSYKVVVAFIDTDLTRETFIYDSSSHSWTVSAAISPALGRDDLVEKGYSTDRIIDRSVRCGDELFWLVRVFTDDGWLRTLIQYNMVLDTWCAVSKLWPWPDREEYTEEEELEGEGPEPIRLASFENQVFLVNFNSSSERTSLRLSEFINLVPNVRKFGVEEFAALLKQGGCTPSFDGFRPCRAVAGNGTWFVECRRDTGNDSLPYERAVFAFSKNGSVIRLPRLDIDIPRTDLCPLAVTFKAFVWEI